MVYLVDTNVLVDLTKTGDRLRNPQFSGAKRIGDCVACPHFSGLQTLDALIAGTALEDALTLVTKNRKLFQMIDGLGLEVPDY
jgi:predicted nucleic acid-binding protein